jgi:hypothetical protein
MSILLNATTTDFQCTKEQIQNKRDVHVIATADSGSFFA